MNLVTIEEAVDYMNEYNFSRQEIQNALDAIRQEDHFNAIRATITVKVWDRVSSINGVRAEKVLQYRKDVKDNSEVYLVIVNEKVLYFQPFHPNLPGFHEMKDAMAQGLLHADEMASESAKHAVLRQLGDLLTSGQH